MRAVWMGVLLGLAVQTRAGTWTVDDNGPADFSSIQAAITALPVGETIIVHPGQYAAFTLDKRMQIFGLLGAPRPRVMDRSVVSGAAAFTLAGLKFDALSVNGVAGRGRIEDCEIVGIPLAFGPEVGSSLRTTECMQLIVTRTTIRGFDSGEGESTPGMSINASTVALVLSSVRGGHGLAPVGFGFCGYFGRPGLIVGGDSHVVSARTTIEGGDGGPDTLGFNNCPGNGATALSSNNAFVELRDCIVVAGAPDIEFTGPPPPPVQFFGGMLIAENVTGTFTGGAVHIVPPYELPTVSLESLVAPGGAGELSLAGPIHQSGLLVVALDAGITSPSQFEGLLWVLPEPSLLVPVATNQLIPFTLPATPTLSGIALTVQVVYPALPGVLDPDDVMTSNPDQLVIRF